jgi:beta-fructofuranosidase
VLTLPRVLDLDENNDLIMAPVEELQSLRTDHVVIKDLSIENSEQKIDKIKGDAIELKFSLKPNDASECGLRVLCSPDGREQTSISYFADKNLVRVDLSKTSLDKSLMSYRWQKDIQEANLILSPNELLKFHVFIDKSVLEVFMNGKLCLTHKVYPSLEASKEIKLYSIGGKIEVPVLNAWKMHPSNPW